MAGLQPLDEELNSECRALAEALRQQFEALGVSVRRYATRRYLNAGTLSRYLAGSRVPQWDFVQNLLTDVAEDRGAAVTPEAMNLLRALHRAAQRTSASMTKAVAQLQQQLADADWEARRSSARMDVLDDALVQRSERIADLEVRLSLQPLNPGDADEQTILAERNRLAAEVTRLRAQLTEAQSRAQLAEVRCELLERQLALVETQRGIDPAEQVFAAVESVRHLLPEGIRPKVLLVDDQPANLLALKSVLQVPDQELVAVSSGQDALKELLQHEDFAVIILDVQMPGMDGYETAAHIKRRAKTRNIPIIFLTAIGTDADYSMRGYSVGAVDFIVKPFDPWALRAKVAVFVDIYLERQLRSSQGRPPAITAPSAG
ncbi:response regulator [Kitasatospora kifunensis]|uniref:CheY-like chemotaxis protein n=1 Tax=Kitasatospora kifunensis TaxID=58351 RepID=A0A7W7RBC2_KITKI|nr:response regulator [Kitasatospora kifunensis]MBB4928836.1 CheY-like chemotaxis protein [Kitasatospora kifunensis]